jgi:uncharacterized membrane protein YfcA
MIEIIILAFLVFHVGNKARKKGQHVLKWRILMVVAWIAAEFLGLMLGVLLLGFSTENLVNLMLIGLVSAIGGYLIIKYNLDKIPDTVNDDIDRIGS